MALLRRVALFLVLPVVLLLLALLGVNLLARGDEPATSADLEFSDVWSRQPVAGQSNAVVYGTVTNTGDADVRITSASAEVTDRVELHETLMEDGMMSMRKKPDGFVVPAGSSFMFEPGGPHVMLLAIDHETYPIDVIDVTFNFDVGDSVSVGAEVRGVDTGETTSNMDYDGEGMDHGAGPDTGNDG